MPAKKSTVRGKKASPKKSGASAARKTRSPKKSAKAKAKKKVAKKQMKASKARVKKTAAKAKRGEKKVAAKKKAVKKTTQRTMGEVKPRKKVYFFGGGKAEGAKLSKEVLGGKGKGLQDMVALGLPVPAGFTIITNECIEYFRRGNKLTNVLKKEVKEAIKKVEKVMGRKFGDPENPLLFSIRSGARVSMPGMMDTVLNLGITSKTLPGLIKVGGERFAYDSLRRFYQMYGGVVLGLKPESEAEEDPFESIIKEVKERRGVEFDVELTVEDLKELVERFRELIKEKTGREIPDDHFEQLWEAIGAVFKSWNNPRAIAYRKLNGIPDDWGTAVNVQSMVFGNMGPDCGTGVAFTRNPSTGENAFYGEYLMNAQGEDVVAGIRDPLPISKSSKETPEQKSLEEEMPDIYKQLLKIRKQLEKFYRDMLDIEFTIERGKLWMLQVRVGKRTGQAEVKIAVDMAKERLISREEAVLRVDPESLEQLLHPVIASTERPDPIAKGRPASPGAARGKIVFTAQEAVRRREADPEGKEEIILVRIQTSPDDVEGMAKANGILTAQGGMTSHAAVVARGMGKSCVVGCGDLKIDYTERTIKVGDLVLHEDDWITIDGSTGEVFAGKLELSPPSISGYLGEFLKWADKFRKIGVRTNADLPHQVEQAVAFGAEGIGLCRTEHMFFAPERIVKFQRMILAETEEERRAALAELLPLQKQDFIEIFRILHGKQATIRLLDPPLHEFMPNNQEQIEELSQISGVSVEQIEARIAALEEANPMLGHRGCRLAVTYPEIYEMQVEAIISAACYLVREEKIKVHPEIMIPLVGIDQELALIRELVEKKAGEVMKQEGVKVKYSVGTMIELPRAALTADEIARYADFFSFGTNDLTQTTYGFSRDDVYRFVGDYAEKGIIPIDPFISLDERGVGKLMKIGIDLGRKANPKLKIGICGEHGGDPASIGVCWRLGLDYVSCSPFRVPTARLAAAQACLRHPKR